MSHPESDTRDRRLAEVADALVTAEVRCDIYESAAKHERRRADEAASSLGEVRYFAESLASLPADTLLDPTVVRAQLLNLIGEHL